jgi:hypothetical protein
LVSIAKTGDAYLDRAKAHVAAHGGKWVVINRRDPAQALQRHAWLAYFAWLDDHSTPKGHKHPAFSQFENMTLPAEWPHEFDAKAPPTPPLEKREAVSPARRMEIADKLRALAAGLVLRQTGGRLRELSPADEAKARLARADREDARGVADPVERSRIVAHHEARLAELKAEYAAADAAAAAVRDLKNAPRQARSERDD